MAFAGGVYCLRFAGSVHGAGNSGAFIFRSAARIGVKKRGTAGGLKAWDVANEALMQKTANCAYNPSCHGEEQGQDV